VAAVQAFMMYRVDCQEVRWPLGTLHSEEPHALYGLSWRLGEAHSTHRCHEKWIRSVTRTPEEKMQCGRFKNRGKRMMILKSILKIGGECVNRTQATLDKD
jgi:hypothetical protein